MILEYSLTKANRIRLARAFRYVPRVDISIECVLEEQMGMAFVDNVENPSAYMIKIGPFHYFAGDVTSSGGQEILKNFQPYNLFMSALPGWAEAFKNFYGERFFEIERYMFSSENISVEHLQKLCQDSKFVNDIKRMDVTLLQSIKGGDHFIDVSDFDSPEDFAERGIGFYIEKNGEVLGAAYSSLVCNTGIEVSLFVADEHRRQGLAAALSANLVRWCFENNMDAHWDAANPESCRLAEKLGYTPQGTYQAYFLKPQK